MEYPWRIHRVTDLAAEFEEATAEMRAVLAKSEALLAESTPDTFLGRARHAPVLLPYQEEQAPLTFSVIATSIELLQQLAIDVGSSTRPRRTLRVLPGPPTILTPVSPR